MQSYLRVSTKYNHHKTVYDDVYFTPPYKLIAPIFEGDEAQIIVLSSSAGLLKDDEIIMDFDFGEKSIARVATQSYEKIFDTNGGKVEKSLNIKAQANTWIRYMPHPTIPFKNSDYCCKTNIQLDARSTFFYSDIFNCGRVFMGEKFLMRKFHSIVKVYVDGKIVFADNTLLEPAQINYASLGLWHEFSHNGLLYAHFTTKDAEDNFIKFARKIAHETLTTFEVGVSRASAGICVRVLGNSGDKIYNYFARISEMSFA